MSLPVFADAARTRLYQPRRIGPENVLVVYRSYVTEDVELAAEYQRVRNIPAANMLPITATGFSDTSTVITGVSVASLAATIDAAVTASGQTIRVLLWVGNWPAKVSYTYFGTVYFGFFDYFVNPAYARLCIDNANSYLWDPVTAATANLPDSGGQGGSFWRNSAQNYDAPQQWDFLNYYDAQGDTVHGAPYRVDPWRNPNRVRNPEIYDAHGYNDPDVGYIDQTTRTYVNFTIPCTAQLKAKYGNFNNYLNTVYIQPEFYNSDWGTALLSTGSAGNPTTRHFVEEAAYEGYPLTKFRWAGYTASTERGTYLFNNTRADQNTEGYATVLPGNAAFTGTAVTDLFFWAPGTLSYNRLNFYPSPSNPNYGFRNGAICVFSQSWGALNGAIEFIDPAAITINTLTATATYTGVPAFLRSNTNQGNSQRLFDITYNGPQSDAMTVAYNAGTITAAGSNAAQTWTASAPAGAELKTIIDNIKAATSGKNWTVWAGGLYANYVMPPALWYFLNKPVAFALGCADEPTNYGDPHLYAMFTTLHYGGNMAEWALRVFNGTFPENTTTFAQAPRYWVMLGDPLYQPLKNRLNNIQPEYRKLDWFGQMINDQSEQDM